MMTNKPKQRVRPSTSTAYLNKRPSSSNNNYNKVLKNNFIQNDPQQQKQNEAKNNILAELTNIQVLVQQAVTKVENNDIIQNMTVDLNKIKQQTLKRNNTLMNFNKKRSNTIDKNVNTDYTDQDYEYEQDYEFGFYKENTPEKNVYNSSKYTLQKNQQKKNISSKFNKSANSIKTPNLNNQQLQQKKQNITSQNKIPTMKKKPSEQQIKNNNNIQKKNINQIQNLKQKPDQNQNQNQNQNDKQIKKSIQDQNNIPTNQENNNPNTQNQNQSNQKQNLQIQNSDQKRKIQKKHNSIKINTNVKNISPKKKPVDKFVTQEQIMGRFQISKQSIEQRQQNRQEREKPWEGKKKY